MMTATAAQLTRDSRDTRGSRWLKPTCSIAKQAAPKPSTAETVWMRSCGVDLGSASGTGQYAEQVTCDASTKQTAAKPSVRAGAHRSSSRADERM